MKLLLPLIPFAALSLGIAAVPLPQSDLGTFEPILRALAELPLVGGLAWILMRQQDRHQDTIKTIMAHFAERSAKKDEFYQRLLTDTLKTVEELAKK